MQIQIREEYRSILESDMDNFGMESVDISFLSGVNRKTIDAILEVTGGIELDSLEAISRVFGLRYFEFGNPEYEAPSLVTLPEKTKNRISLRKKVGPSKPIHYEIRLLREKIIILLAKFNLGEEFLSTDIRNQFTEEFDEQVKTSEVSLRLNKYLSEFTLNISKENKNKVKGKVGRKANRYRLIKEIPIELLLTAKDTIQ